MTIFTEKKIGLFYLMLQRIYFIQHVGSTARRYIFKPKGASYLKYDVCVGRKSLRVFK
jgi:hypothetical protein